MLSEGDAGVALTASTHKRALEYARKIAKIIALKRVSRTVSIDDLDRVYAHQGASLWDELGFAAGAVFRSSEWKFTGRIKERSICKSHSRLVKVWRYVG